MFSLLTILVAQLLIKVFFIPCTAHVNPANESNFIWWKSDFSSFITYTCIEFWLTNEVWRVTHTFFRSFRLHCFRKWDSNHRFFFFFFIFISNSFILWNYIVRFYFIGIKSMHSIHKYSISKAFMAIRYYYVFLYRTFIYKDSMRLFNKSSFIKREAEKILKGEKRERKKLTKRLVHGWNQRTLWMTDDRTPE